MLFDVAGRFRAFRALMSLPSGTHLHCLHQDSFEFFTMFTLLAAGWCRRYPCSHGTPEAQTQAFPLCQNIVHLFGMIVRIFNTRLSPLVFQVVSIQICTVQPSRQFLPPCCSGRTSQCGHDHVWNEGSKAQRWSHMAIQ